MFPIEGENSISFSAKPLLFCGGLEPGSPEALDLTNVFPYGAFSFNLYYIPTTSYPLAHNLRVFFARRTSPPIYNQSVRSLFGVEWEGSIVVAKYGRRKKNEKHAIQMLIHERDMINVIVGM